MSRTIESMGLSNSRSCRLLAGRLDLTYAMRPPPDEFLSFRKDLYCGMLNKLSLNVMSNLVSAKKHIYVSLS